MRIKEMFSQVRRDFYALYECEHCGKTKEGYGYDDDNFHKYVVPNMECAGCGKKSDESYVPRVTKYAANEIV